MQRLTRYVTHNWLTKVFSLALAVMLWMTVATQTSSEIGMDLPIEYRNIPKDLEVTGDAINVVHVRLRGASNVIRGISAEDISTTLDLADIVPGEKTVPLTAQNVSVPFGVEVVRVSPARIQLNLERTMTRTLPVTPTLEGMPAKGYRLDQVVIQPKAGEVQGPESSIKVMESIPTAVLNIEGVQTDIKQSVDLEPPDPLVRVLQPRSVDIEITIRPAP
jgi:YbbR domain-containing protein